MKNIKQILITEYGIKVLESLLEQKLGKKLYFKSPSKMKKYIISRYVIIERNGWMSLSRKGIIVEIIISPISVFVQYSNGEYHGGYRGCESSRGNLNELKQLRKHHYAKYKETKEKYRPLKIKYLRGFLLTK